jgi:hypothetical protein
MTGCKRFVETGSGGGKRWVEGAGVCCAVVVRGVDRVEARRIQNLSLHSPIHPKFLHTTHRIYILVTETEPLTPSAT